MSRNAGWIINISRRDRNRVNVEVDSTDADPATTGAEPEHTIPIQRTRGRERHQRSRYPTMEKRSSFFPTRSENLQGIVQAVDGTAWHRASISIKSPSLTERLRLSLLCRLRIHRHSTMLLELFYMLEVCCGSGASSRAMISYMRRIGREGKSLY